MTRKARSRSVGQRGDPQAGRSLDARGRFPSGELQRGNSQYPLPGILPLSEEDRSARAVRSNKGGTTNAFVPDECVFLLFLAGFRNRASELEASGGSRCSAEGIRRESSDSKHQAEGVRQGASDWKHQAEDFRGASTAANETLKRYFGQIEGASNVTKRGYLIWGNVGCLPEKTVE